MTECRVSAVLFDLDGTLVDSTAVVETLWKEWADQHSLDVNAILAISHGRRAQETMREIAPHLYDIEEQAAARIRLEEAMLDGVVALPGAERLLAQIPPERWAVVTACPPVLARNRLCAAGLPYPAVLVSGDDVAQGKPHPEGYLRAAERLGVPPCECLVVEDAPAGVEAGLAAGMRVLALATTHDAARLRGHWVLRDLSGVVADVREAEVFLRIPAFVGR